MKELFSVVKKKKLILLFFLKLISYFCTFGVSFAYANYITSPLTSSKLENLIIVLIILFVISLIINYLCAKMHDLFIIDLKYLKCNKYLILISIFAINSKTSKQNQVILSLIVIFSLSFILFAFFFKLFDQTISCI